MSIATTNHATEVDSAAVRREFEALLSDCGVYSLENRAQITITGGDRTRWLNGMATNNIRDLQPGHGVYAFLLNPQGRILGDLHAYNRGKLLLAETDRAQVKTLLATFDHYIIMDDVEVTDISDKQRLIGAAGPKSRQVLREAGLEIPVLAPLQFVDVTWQGAQLTVARGDNSSIETYEVWASAEQPLEDALVKAGGTRVSPEALELLRIASGIPRYGQDIHERDLPQETGQDRALHFSKGCYIGQEIVERIRSRGAVHRNFTGFQVQGKLPATGTKIQSGGKEVGEITSAALLLMSTGDLPAALGYLRREAAGPEKQLLADGAELSVAALPFAEVFSRPNQ
jgi:folate-binding protein YgfZ